MKNQRGQVLIEFALITPLIMLLLFMVVDVGLLLIRKATLDDAVRQGAMEAAAGVGIATVQAYTAERTMGLVEPASVVVCQPDEEHVRVSTTWTYSWLSGGIVSWLGGGDLGEVVLHPSADRRIEVEGEGTPTPMAGAGAAGPANSAASYPEGMEPIDLCSASD